MVNSTNQGSLVVRKPVVSSLAAAQAEFNHWLLENTFATLHDRAGGVWRSIVRLKQEPSPGEARKAWFLLAVSIKSSMTSKSLCDTAVLCPDNDTRLIALLGEMEIPLTLPLGEWEGGDMSTMRSHLQQSIVKAREILRVSDLSRLKRQRLSWWLDSHSIFGQKVASMG